MKVTAIEVIPVAMDLPEPLRWGLFAVSKRGACLLRIRTDEGITGIGECGFSADAAPMIEPQTTVALSFVRADKSSLLY